MSTYGKIYDSLYPAFPKQIRKSGSHGMTVLEVTQDSHETKDPCVDDIVFRMVVASDQTHSSVDIGEGRRVLSTNPGSFYLAPANAIADWRSEGSHKILMLAVGGDRLSTLLSDENGAQNADPLRRLYGRDICNTEVTQLMRKILLESQSEGAGAGLKVDGFFLTLLGALANLGQENPSSPKAPVPPLDKRRLDRVCAYIDAHLDEQIRIEDLANEIGLSPFHFARAFRAAMNMPPHKYLLARRLDAAAAMIRDDTANLAEIALLSGFSSQAHLTRQFTKHFGETPGKYRRRCRA